MTKARKAVLGALAAASEPLCATAVARLLAGDCDQATVYRALHYLEGAGLAESFVLHCTEHGVERYYVSLEAPHGHWFHCESCHRFVSLGACGLGGLLSGFERDLGVTIRSHTLYLTGLCAECRSRG